MFLEFLNFWLLQSFLCLSKWLNKFTKIFIGYSFYRGWISEKISYENCAHRMKIAWKGRSSAFASPSQDCFLLFHKSYESPKMIQENDKITLMSLNEKYLLFCVTDVNVYDSKFGAFVYSSQFEFIKEVILVPVEFLHRLAEDLGEPSSNLILLSNTGRCGSTILTQMLEACPRTLSMSEADFLSVVDKIRHNKNLPSSLRPTGKVLKSLLNIQCKDFKEEKFDHIIIKPRSQSIVFASEIFRVFPKIKHVYMWREFEPFFRSIRSLGDSFPDFMFRMTVAKFFQKMLRKSIIPDEFKTKEIDSEIFDLTKNTEKFQIFAILAALQYLSYLKQRTLVPFHVIKYEKLLSNPSQEFFKLAEHCGIQEYDIQKVLETLNQDSQEKSQLSQQKLKSLKKDLADQEIEKILDIFAKLGLPHYKDFDMIF